MPGQPNASVCPRPLRSERDASAVSTTGNMDVIFSVP